MKYSKQKQSQRNCYLKKLQNELTELSEKLTETTQRLS